MPPRVVDGERSIGLLAQRAPLRAQLVSRTNGRAHAAERTGVADRGRQLDLVPGTKWREHDRHVGAEQVAEGGAQQGRSSSKGRSNVALIGPGQV
jgi:hypothetical protein